MGNFFRINEVVNNASLPRLPYQTNNGTILLMDNGISKIDIAPFKAAANAVPTQSATASIMALENLAIDIPRARGLGEFTVELHMGGTSTGEFVNSVDISKTTAKGGLYIKTKTGFLTTLGTAGANITMPQLGRLNEYNRANNPVYFGSFWGRAVSNNGNDEIVPRTPLYLLKVGTNINNYFIVAGSNSSTGQRGNVGRSAEGDYTNPDTPLLRQVAGSFEPPASLPTFQLPGAIMAWNTASQSGKKPMDTIVYRMYIEDLTLSGNTWEQAKANDDQLYQAAFAVGGRFHGDTW